MTNLELAYQYFCAVLDSDLQNVEPEVVTGWAVIEALWPLNELFRPHAVRIRSLRYDRSFERAADEAIVAFAERPHSATWDDLSPGAWRVLLERHQQLLVVAAANEAAGIPFTRLPRGLPEWARMPGLMLLLMHSMKLLKPAQDRSDLDIPDGGPTTLRLQ